MPIEINALETKRFGVTCAKRIDANAPLQDVNAAAMAQGVQMISTRIDAGDLAQVHALEDDGYRLMDALVYYGRKLDGAWSEPEPRHDYTLRLATTADADAVAQVSRTAFKGYMGHYHTDPRLDSRQADAAYVEWAENSVRHMTGDDTAVVVVDGDTVVGFVTLRRNSDAQFELVLSGVQPDYQRSGIYASLLTRGFSTARDRGASEVILSTQINNYAVQKVWARLGMHHQSSYYTFHKWFD
ncbi:GNAT family N-acetyltransferase [Yoonia sp. R2-816]|uniref:GNAT family N-acetyltransferase n=1 Tax=Yoonia sp. R2-816 TaxID=3342638 RepID=UPI00372871B7